MIQPKQCQQCGKLFTPSDKKPNQKFCCRECWRQSLVTRVDKVCPRCGQTFSVQIGQANRRKYCSSECRKDQVKKNCTYCGTEFSIKASHADRRECCSRYCAMKLRAIRGTAPMTGKHRKLSTRQKVSEGLKRYYAKNPQGHWNFKGVGYNEYRGNWGEWQKTKRQIRKRDNFTCQACGLHERDSDKRHSVHHVIPFREFTDWREANHPSNLVALCQSCHMKVEHGTITLSE